MNRIIDRNKCAYGTRRGKSIRSFGRNFFFSTKIINYFSRSADSLIPYYFRAEHYNDVPISQSHSKLNAFTTSPVFNSRDVRRDFHRMIRNRHHSGCRRGVHGDDRVVLLECILWHGTEYVFRPEILNSLLLLSASSAKCTNRHSHDKERASQFRLARGDRLALSLDMEHLKICQNIQNE